MTKNIYNWISYFLKFNLHQVSNKLWIPVITQYFGITFHTTYIRKEKYRPATTPAAAATPMYVTLTGPPWILKWAGLESSGQRLISSIGKTKRIYKNWQKKYFKILRFFEDIFFVRFFHIFILRIGLDWRALVQSHIPNIEKQRVFFLAERFFCFKNFQFFFEKKNRFFDNFWHFFFFFFFNFLIFFLIILYLWNF